MQPARAEGELVGGCRAAAAAAADWRRRGLLTGWLTSACSAAAAAEIAGSDVRQWGVGEAQLLLLGRSSKRVAASAPCDRQALLQSCSALEAWTHTGSRPAEAPSSPHLPLARRWALWGSLPGLPAGRQQLVVSSRIESVQDGAMHCPCGSAASAAAAVPPAAAAWPRAHWHLRELVATAGNSTDGGSAGGRSVIKAGGEERGAGRGVMVGSGSRSGGWS